MRQPCELMLLFRNTSFFWYLCGDDRGDKKKKCTSVGETFILTSFIYYVTEYTR